MTNAKQVTLKYLEHADKDAMYIASVAGGQIAEHPGDYQEREVDVWNGRVLPAEPGLDKEGFRLVSHSSKVGNFFDDQQIASIYEPEIKELVLKHTGAARVEVFDHTRRATSACRARSEPP